jgi:uncharacterized membrane protein
MNIKIPHSILRAAGLGLIAGMRTNYAPAVASHVYSRHPTPNLDGSPLIFMRSITTSKVLKVMAAGELVADKLPNTPDRIKPVPVAGRLLSGILVGATVYEADGKKPLIGAIVGGSAAVASTFGMFFLRKALKNSTGLPNWVLGIMEDSLVIGAGSVIAKDL